MLVMIGNMTQKLICGGQRFDVGKRRVLAVHLSADRTRLDVFLNGTPPPAKVLKLIRSYRQMFLTILTHNPPDTLPDLNGDSVSDFVALAALEVFMSDYCRVARERPILAATPERLADQDPPVRRLRPIRTEADWALMITDLTAQGGWPSMLYCVATSPPGPTRTETIARLLRIPWPTSDKPPLNSPHSPGVWFQSRGERIDCRFVRTPASPVIAGWTWQHEHLIHSALSAPEVVTGDLL